MQVVCRACNFEAEIENPKPGSRPPCVTCPNCGYHGALTRRDLSGYNKLAAKRINGKMCTCPGKASQLFHIEKDAHVCAECGIAAAIQ